MVLFIQELGYSVKCDMLSAIHTDQMHQPWRTFTAIINRCISGKTTRLDRLRESRAQILWGIYNKKNVDFVALLWKDVMFQADNRDISPAHKEHMPYPRFTKFIINHFISKDKTIFMRNKINLQIVRDDTLLGTLKFKARKFKKVASPLKKLSLVLEEEPAVKLKRAKNAKKSTIVPTVVLLLETLLVCLCRRRKHQLKLIEAKAWINFLKQHYLKLLSSRKLSRKASWKLTSFMQVAQVMELVPNQRFLMSLKIRQLGDGDDDSNDDESDDDSNDDDDDNEDEEEEYEEEYVHTPDNYEFTDDDEEYEELYKDVNVRLKDTEHEEEGKGDAEMTDVGRDDGTQQTTYEQVKDDEHVILTTVHDTQKTEVQLKSSSVSSDFANQFLNLDNVPPTDSEVVSMINVKVRHEEPSTQTPSLLNIPVMVIPETLIASRPTIPLTILPITPLPQQTTPTPTPAPTTTTSIPALLDFSSLFGFDQRNAFQSYTTEFEKKAKDEKKRYIDLVEKSVKDIIKDEAKTQEHKDLYDALVKSYKLDKDLFESYGKAYSLKRDREDKDKDEDPLAGSDQRLKKWKMSKDVEPSKGSKLKESKSSSSKGTKSQSKSYGKSAQAEESMFETADTKIP
ncbi:hypothetical protein Tco_0871797 [Tanacetum coccineum]